MGPLEILRQSAKYLIPSRMPDTRLADFMHYAKEVYTPQHMRAQTQEAEWLKRAQEARTAEQAAKFMQAAKEAEYRAARFSKLDQAARSIGTSARLGDEELRAFMLPGIDDVPSGLATFYPPGHLAGDPWDIASRGAELELLGTAPEARGAGRVLLREVGMDSPTDPLVWNSTNYPATKKFYEARGGVEVPHSKIPRGSLFERGSMPIFHVPQGSMIKEKKGGLVRMKEARCGR